MKALIYFNFYLVSMPGLDVQNCFKAANGGQARCLSFKENKFTGVSNVGCLSKCESERVQSFAKRRSLDTKAGVSIFPNGTQSCFNVHLPLYGRYGR